MQRYDLSDFCRRACAIDDGEPDRYVRIRQREGRSRVVVAARIDTGTDPGDLAARIARELAGLDSGPAWIELMAVGGTSPLSTQRVVIERRADERDDDAAGTVADGIAGILAEARRMMASADERAQRAQEQAWAAMAQTAETREQAILTVAQIQQAATDADDTAAAWDRFAGLIGPLVPVLAARLIGRRAAALPQQQRPQIEQRDEADEAAGQVDQVDEAAVKACALEAIATLEFCAQAAPGLIKDPEVIERMAPLVRAALGV